LKGLGEEIAMPTHSASRESDGQSTHAHRGERRSSAAQRAKERLEDFDVPAAVRDHPWAALGIAGGVGLVIGATLGSRLVRMLVGSVGMFTVSELLRRYARRTLDEMDDIEADAD
jgi:hypothetical protein